ncbi:hypothetical protein K437DRAFT_281040 [Tilletiaria anomala UBC 951]|uniref:Saccharopine dehydrogenase NADP binding domain-containing protein n=1 Tax=Tilletiaria anomala (strain ATCC 24038 / CBS 436.72 / UBC 951) TaxID=1037660 RepID=A0A066VIK3_TILAU|nr:uncharacterized protein K437DRAFT_281040 [Tilletiaria anomala UBC 951]KDN38385.1 hypothetical protein K437DRAFT_281040 [Tilletiaria anomala UBC 951]
MSNEIVDIVVFGATAVTGKHTVRYLLSHRERSTFTFAIAGRSSNKLSALRAELSIPDCVPTIVADSFDADSIAAMVAKAKVVINLAGPYNVFNARGIVAECVKQGKAYTDLTGESGFYKKVIDEFHDQAKQNGVPIVMSCGFDSTPSDMGTFLAVQHLKSQAPASRITDVTTAVRISSTIGKGTLMSGVDMVTQSKRENEDTTWQLKSVRPDEFSPIDSKRPMPWGPVIKAPHGTRAGALAFFPLACHNHRVVSRTWGLLETELKGNKEAYGDAFQYAEGIVMPNATVAAIVTIFVKTFLLFQIWFPPVRRMQNSSKM